MSRPIHRLALAAAMLCAPALSSIADALPPERPNKPSVLEDGPAIFLGTVSAAGAWRKCNVDPAPGVVVGDPAKLLEELQAVTLTTSLKVHQAPRPSATVISRHKVGTKLSLVGMHISGSDDTFYVWGLIDRGRADAGAETGGTYAVLENPMPTTLRCGHTAIHVKLYLPDEAPAIVECASCRATWPLLDDRLTTLDFRNLGGPVATVILPASGPHQRC